ncbi:MAG: right-handed parallel beta-helix repeat-containing protein [Candidatus Tenebribacter burtonii]|nr:right-handed parallel beta-helix repeat-containing protein [Candidatus Tenebribacter burtonii]
MKKLVLIICSLFLTVSVFATDVLGNQSGIWNLAGSPYNIIGEITIPTNETLQIDAGVEVIAMGNYRITALGNIEAQGVISDTIRFYGNGGLNWGGLHLEDEVTTSQFDYCRISNTDDTNDYGIQSINSPVFINYSYLDDHQKAISFSALSANDPSYMEIKNSKIAYVQKSGITITDNSNVLIDSCEVTRCAIGGSPYGAIQLSLQSNSHSCSPTITNNYIHHNDMQGITLANLFGYDNMAPLVEYNEISYNYTGIYLYVGKGTYIWNHIHHNFVENNPDSGAGVMLYGNGADAVFTYNKINNNYTGFYLANGATANLGDLENASTDDDGYNCIYDNIFYTGEEFSVYNASASNVTAENTVWDTDPPIDVSIIDGNDNPAYGIVDYEPTLSPYAPPAELIVTVSGNSVIIQIPYGTAYPTLPLNIEGCNIYRDGVLIEEGCVGLIYIDLNFPPPGEHTYGVTIVYEGGFESLITETTIYIPYVLNPPQNPNVTSSGYITWEEPEPGSTSPFLHYNIYLDGSLHGSTTDLFYQLTGLVNGQQYLVGLSAEYEAGESDILEFELPYVSSADNTIQKIELLNNYPNPFNPSTTISFTLNLEDNKKVELYIFNLKGQKIQQFSIINDQSSIVWDGTDDNNKPVSSGVYFYKLVADGKNLASKKMLLLK